MQRNVLVDFKPYIRTVSFMSSRTTKELRDEPMIWTGDYNFSRKEGGVITQEFLDKIEATDYYKDAIQEKGLNFILDSRVTHTMPGQYPSMGGWHCDDFNRTVKYGQPLIENRDRRICHFVALISELQDGVSCTEFITENCTLEVNPDAVWNSVDSTIEALKIKPKSSKVKPKEIVFFNQDAIHRASACTTAGWRFFIRGSFTYRKPENEIRKQVQVYIDRKGW